MIVQTAPRGSANFVITMQQHTALAADFARHFGNADFEPVSPVELVLFVVQNHDAGWQHWDQLALMNPATGPPYHLVQTPFEEILKTSSASPDFNAEHHAFCGLLSSMHSWGLYNGRYGLSDKVLLDGLTGEKRALADAVLDAELARQAVLTEQLSSASETAGWVERSALFQNYKQLQFFDTLALYFNCAHAGERVETKFAHVPRDSVSDTEITLRPLGDDLYSLTPYPFDRSPFPLAFAGRYVQAARVPAKDSDAEWFQSHTVTSQAITLVSEGPAPS